MILAIHERIAELWTQQRKRKLTADEVQEMITCLDANASHCFRLAKLENLSLLASMTNDSEWQHEICRRIEELSPYRG
jgi:hypothetical protein